MKSKSFAVGSKVKLTGKFLRSTGQQLGSAGMDRWIVQECQCVLCKFDHRGRIGSFVCTNEPSFPGLYTAEEIAAQPSLGFRHIAVANLQSA